IRLDGMDIIPFDYSAGALGGRAPSFEVVVNGSHAKAILDTGASYLAMSPALANKLGIKSVPVGEGRASQQQTQAYLGVAEFSLGRVSATNIPVYVLPPLGILETRDTVVFGTTFLANFLTTVDYPRPCPSTCGSITTCSPRARSIRIPT